MQDPERPGRHQQGQALVQGRTPLRAAQRGLHRLSSLGEDGEGREGPGPGGSRERLARPGVEGAVRRGSAGDARACPEGTEAREGWKPLPVERSPQVRRLRQALSRPGSQERPVRLLHLRDAVQRGCRDVHRPLPERPETGDVYRREDTGENPHRGDHRGACDVGGGGDRRDGGRACR